MKFLKTIYLITFYHLNCNENSLSFYSYQKKNLLDEKGTKDKKISKPEDEINYNSKKYLASLSSKKKETNNPTQSYSANGRWLIDCENG